MKQLSFEVQIEDLLEFVKIIAEYELDNEMIGYTEENNLLISITYPKDKWKAMRLLLEYSLLWDEDDTDELEED